MEGKNSFVLYSDIEELVNELTDNNAGKLFKHILAYVNDKNPEAPNQIVKLSSIPILQSLKRDGKKWRDTLGKKSEGGQLGNLKRYHIDLYEQVKSGEIKIEDAVNVAKGRSARKDVAPLAVSVSVSDSVSVSVSAGKTRASIPSLEIFLDYCFDVYAEIYKRNPEEIRPSATLKYQTWVDGKWRNGRGEKILNWKNMIRNTIPHLAKEKPDSIGVSKQNQNLNKILSNGFLND